MEMADIPGSTHLSEDEQSKHQDHDDEEDIMQLARLGDIPAMEKLFESKGYDATYMDDEGITPLHVRLALGAFPPPRRRRHANFADALFSLVGCYQ
jgi:ankyrin repeat protein